MILSDSVILKGHPWGLGLVPHKWVGPGTGVATSLLVSKPRLRRFYEMILKFFCK